MIEHLKIPWLQSIWRANDITFLHKVHDNILDSPILLGYIHISCTNIRSVCTSINKWNKLLLFNYCSALNFQLFLAQLISIPTKLVFINNLMDKHTKCMESLWKNFVNQNISKISINTFFINLNRYQFVKIIIIFKLISSKITYINRIWSTSTFDHIEFNHS